MPEDTRDPEENRRRLEELMRKPSRRFSGSRALGVLSSLAAVAVAGWYLFEWSQGRSFSFGGDVEAETAVAATWLSAIVALIGLILILFPAWIAELTLSEEFEWFVRIFGWLLLVGMPMLQRWLAASLLNGG